MKRRTAAVSQFARLGCPEDYADGVTKVLNQRAFIVREGNRFRALSGTCAHLGCQPEWRDNLKRLNCPRHGSRFDAYTGSVLQGPAQLRLPFYKLTLVNRQLVVEPEKELTADRYLTV